jgi:hypothetical protein
MAAQVRNILENTLDVVSERCWKNKGFKFLPYIAPIASDFLRVYEERFMAVTSREEEGTVLRLEDCKGNIHLLVNPSAEPPSAICAQYQV